MPAGTRSGGEGWAGLAGQPERGGARTAGRALSADPSRKGRGGARAGGGAGRRAVTPAGARRRRRARGAAREARARGRAGGGCPGAAPPRRGAAGGGGGSASCPGPEEPRPPPPPPLANMADLEAVLADVSYLMAMEKSKATPAARASKRIVLPEPRYRLPGPAPPPAQPPSAAASDPLRPGGSGAPQLLPPAADFGERALRGRPRGSRLSSGTAEGCWEDSGREHRSAPAHSERPSKGLGACRVTSLDRLHTCLPLLSHSSVQPHPCASF